jgi:hypothetical protein
MDVSLDFVDLLYAVPVAALATRVAEDNLEHVSAAGWGDIVLALIAISLGWIGHHTNRKRRRQDAPDPIKVSNRTFSEWAFLQFWVEALVIGAYFALSTRLSLPGEPGGSAGRMQWKADWILSLFALYVLWDILDVASARASAGQARQDTPARPCDAQKHDDWAGRATQGGIVSSAFVIVFVVVRAVTPSQAGYSTLPFDVTCIAILYIYRLFQQRWIVEGVPSVPHPVRWAAARFIALKALAGRVWGRRRRPLPRSMARRLILAAILLIIAALIAFGHRLFTSHREAPRIDGISPSQGSLSGGTRVRVHGEYFDPGGTSFSFGGRGATSVSCLSTTTCTLTSPGHAAGTAGVVATVAGSSSPVDFTYVRIKPPPPSYERVQVELSALGRRRLDRLRGKRCHEDDLHGRVLGSSGSAPVVLAYRTADCLRLRVTLTPQLGTIYYLRVGAP